MRVLNLHCKALPTHVSNSTILRALHEQGIKAYYEEFKFILKLHNMTQRLVSTYLYFTLP
jgi:hypothetical protein